MLNVAKFSGSYQALNKDFMLAVMNTDTRIWFTLDFRIDRVF